MPEFLYKRDVIPGRTSKFQIIPQQVGEYRGKCAELCGEEHSAMLFNVKVVTRADYDAHMQELRAKGQTGALGLVYSRLQHVPSATQGSGN